jgi:hypothetical protein
MLQAENQEEMKDWIYCLQTTAQDAIYSDPSAILIANTSKQFQVCIFFFYKSPTKLLCIFN